MENPTPFFLPHVWEGTVREPRKRGRLARKYVVFVYFWESCLGFTRGRGGRAWEGLPQTSVGGLALRLYLVAGALFSQGCDGRNCDLQISVKARLCCCSFGTRALVLLPEHSLRQVLSQRRVPRKPCPGSSLTYCNLQVWFLEKSVPPLTRWTQRPLKTKMRASLVAQWLRIHLPMQGTRVRALVREDPTCRGATEPVHHYYWACALEPASHNYWARVPQLLKPARLEPVLHNKRSHHNEKPAHRNKE